MLTDDHPEVPPSASLKKLRQARRQAIAAAAARVKEQRRALKAIRTSLAGAELTVPELAAATGLPASEVLWYLATLKKYGDILEGPQAGSYFRYRLGQGAAAAAETED
jgi:hypothetical protein